MIRSSLREAAEDGIVAQVLDGGAQCIVFSARMPGMGPWSEEVAGRSPGSLAMGSRLS